MDLATLRDFFFWCSVINYGVLVVWFLLFLLMRGWLYRCWERGFGLSLRDSARLNFGGMLLFKLGVLLFNLVPYVALRIIG
ncbi:DUF6868 family protein [Crenobacter cavernae]|uniref:DUF6868 domain-containing protein n=1 Tax=Crenobacter cavernae TaxID=2290923 RepID=A0A345Y7I7_9NEIS|nr:hypothetical protein [Crenobacter cavernae]AXK39889.1 hypothetical protein DWG20_10800 [Crenobacter cavernae]